MENIIKLFEDRSIRYAWDAEREEWFFSAVDVCYALADSASKAPGAYWRKLKQRLINEGSEVVTLSRTEAYRFRWQIPGGC